jgi:hypothetical protein
MRPLSAALASREVLQDLRHEARNRFQLVHQEWAKKDFEHDTSQHNHSSETLGG